MIFGEKWRILGYKRRTPGQRSYQYQASFDSDQLDGGWTFLTLIKLHHCTYFVLHSESAVIPVQCYAYKLFT
jgi:hypothetical protein